MATLSAQERAGALTYVHDSSGRAQVSDLLFRLAKGKVRHNQASDAVHRAYLQTVLALPFADDAEKKTFLLWLSRLVLEQSSLVVTGTECLRDLFVFWQRTIPDTGKYPFALVALEFSLPEQNRFARALGAIQDASRVPLGPEDWRFVLRSSHGSSRWSSFRGFLLLENRLKSLRRLASFRSALWEQVGINLPLEELVPQWMELKPQVAKGLEKAALRLLSLQPGLATPAHLGWLLKMLEYLAQSVNDYGQWECLRERNAGFIASVFVDFLTSEGFLTLLRKLGFGQVFHALRGCCYFEQWLHLERSELVSRDAVPLVPEPWRGIEGLTFERIARYLPACILDYPQAWDRDLVLGILQGRSIRSCMPYLSKAEAHLLSQLPPLGECYGPKLPNAVWKVKLLAAGADPGLMNLFNRYAGGLVEQMPFWETVVHFFAKYREEVNPHGYLTGYVFNFIAHKRQEDPGFSMKGRTWSTLSRQANDWENEVRRNRMTSQSSLFWKGASYKPWVSDAGDGAEYVILQLKSGSDLDMEGKAMGHCVGSYAGRCQKGSCSIWSLRRIENGEAQSLVTIEVNSLRQVVQAKARFNALPPEEHHALIRQWADREGLTLVAR